ncbi:MAG: hypothetical protein ABS46_08500 [Cytophagaceae bacterium SCN 52-12]|nr:MAG: hypothetical protein ABS46_08500 [Cytophagaceae bacterium SCN 52-12]
MRKIIFFAIFIAFATFCRAQDVSLFDGHTLKGWKVSDPAYAHLWKVENNLITGGDGAGKIPVNSYLVTEKAYKNFEFRCLFRLTGDPSTGMINSGIQYRSEVKNKDMIGYQADIGDGYWGDIYDEHRRGKLVSGETGILKETLNPGGWNSYIIRCTGARHQLYINGIKTADYLEKDNSILQQGVFGIQIHSGGNAQIFLKNIEIEELPE